MSSGNLVLNLTGAQLSALLDHLNVGGVPNASNFTFEQTPDGLVMRQGADNISQQSVDGSWFKTSVSTGVGSLHLGGNESGGVAHSLSSTGQNVGFKNEFSKAAAGEKIFFYPTWQGVSCDGQTRYAATMRSYGPFAARNEVNGSPHASITLPYNFTLNVTGSAGSGTETYAVTVLPAENYTGKLNNIIISNTTGAEIYNTSVDVAAVAGTELKIDYKYPFSALSGDNLQLRLVKENGDYLLVRAGTTNTAIPWRALSNAAINSIEVAAATGYANNRVMITDSDGRISVSALQNNRAVVSNATGAPIAATTTATEVDNIRGGVTRNTSVVIEDGDGFVFNDGGTMMQASAGRVWAYTQGKMTGAISTAITGNLTANRMVYTDANGKLTVATPSANRVMVSDANSGVVAAAAITASRALASNANGIPEASSTTTAELNNIRGGVTRDAAVTLADDDGVVVNDGGTMIQAAMSRVWAYIQSKITGAVSGALTSNFTANQALISGSDGKITTRNLGASRIMVTDANGLPTATSTLVANRIMMTDSNGLPTTASATGPIYYTGSTNAAGTTTVISGFKGGFTVSFVRTSTTIYLQVTHTQLGSRYQYQTTTNSGSPSAFWTSSSGQNYPANLPSLASNGGSMSGWFFGTDGNSQLETIRVDFSIITNGAATAVMWCRVC